MFPAKNRPVRWIYRQRYVTLNLIFEHTLILRSFGVHSWFNPLWVSSLNALTVLAIRVRLLVSPLPDSYDSVELSTQVRSF